MAFAKYNGHKAIHVRGGVRVRAVPQDEHSTSTAFGTDFPRGFWVPIDHLSPAHQKKLVGNPGFSVVDTVPAGQPVLDPEDVVIGPAHTNNPTSVEAFEEVDDMPPKATTAGKGKAAS